MTSIILSIGDELVLGQTVDTNSAWLSRQLAAAGVDTIAHFTVSDAQHPIELAMLYAAERCDIVVVTGGLGPTADDLTRQALATVINAPLELNAEWFKEMEGYFSRIGRPMPPTNRIQAMIPRGARMIFNHNGTAAGIDATYQSPDQKTISRIFSMPGVPAEMKRMFESDVLPILRVLSGGAVVLSRTLHTFGVGESALAEKLGALMARDRNPSVGTTVSGGGVSLRLNSRFATYDAALTELNRTAEACRGALGDLIYGADDDTLQSVVAELLRGASAPNGHGPTVATAESCTGGLLAKLLTDVPGSSAYFKEGFITYSNDAKMSLIGVPSSTLERFGAVSEPTAIAMAEGARRTADADYALSITGIAGPDGGSDEKPVGTVCIGLATRDATSVRTFRFTGDRDMIRSRSAQMAMTLLRMHLLGKAMPF